jgi:hypothetical protein
MGTVVDLAAYRAEQRALDIGERSMRCARVAGTCELVSLKCGITRAYVQTWRLERILGSQPGSGCRIGWGWDRREVVLGAGKPGADEASAPPPMQTRVAVGR